MAGIRHLTPDDLADLAEGMRAESSAPHLLWCESCRQQLAEIRAVLADATDVDVPEPSLATQSVPVGPNARPHAFTSFESTFGAPAPFWSETSFVTA